MILIASTLAQGTLPANVGVIVILVLLIAVFGFGALLWSAAAGNSTSSKETSSSTTRVLRAPMTATRSKAEAAAAKPSTNGAAFVATPQAVAPVEAPTLVFATAPAAPDAAAPDAAAPDAAVVETVTLPEEPAVSHVPGEPDDLQRIEGIGPKIAGALKTEGIVTYAQLAAMTPDQLRSVLTGKVRLFNPDTWPAQARLAAAARWDELVEYQSTLKAGRRA